MSRHAIYSLLMVLFALAGALVSFILAEEYYYIDLPRYEGGEPGVFTSISAQICGEADALFSCATVSRSKYAILFGIPMAIYGLFFFLTISFLSIAHMLASSALRTVIGIVLFWTVVLGVIADMVLLGISLFLIDAFCPLCLLTYGSTGCLLAMAILLLIDDRANPCRVISMFRAPGLSHHRYGKVVVIFVVCAGLLSAAGAAYTIGQSLKRNKVNYILAHKESEIRRVVADFSEQQEVPIQAPAMRVAGDPEAPVAIVEFSDFLCPFCAYISEVMERLVAQNPGKVQVLFVNYPLDIGCNRFMRRVMHRGACEIAKGAICAARQRGLAAYQKLAFGERKQGVGRDDLTDWASRTGLSVPEFERCLDHPETEQILHWQIEQARRLDITGTPTVYINNRRYRGRLYEEALQRIIDLELQRLK